MIIYVKLIDTMYPKLDKSVNFLSTKRNMLNMKNDFIFYEIQLHFYL